MKRRIDIFATVCLAIAIWGMAPASPCFAQPGTPAAAPPAAAAAPMLTADQAELLGILGGFYRRFGVRVPGGTQNMADRLEAWSHEVIIVPVKTGEKKRDLLGSEGRGRMPPEKDVYEMRRLNRIHFRPFTEEEEGGTNAEYDPITGSLAVNTTLVGRLRPDASISPNGESAVQQLFQRIEIAQTFVHEMIHSGQGLFPGSPGNEAIAYRETLTTTHNWLRQFEQSYAAARTKENARYVWAAADAWMRYLATIQNEVIPKGIATADALPAAEAQARAAELVRITELRDRMAQEHRAIEILEQMAGPAVVPGTARTLDELLVGLTAHDLQELDQRVRKAARGAVDQGAGDLRGGHYTPPQRDEKADQLTAGALPMLREVWRSRLREAATAMRNLEAFSLIVRLRPESGMIDPETKTAKVVADVENDAEFARLVDALGRSLQRATGDPAKLTVVDVWTATDFPPAPQVWRPGLGKTFEVPKEQDYLIEVRRTVHTRVNSASPKLTPKLMLHGQNIFLVEPAKAPTNADLAGVWTGTLTITDMPMLAVAAGGGQSETSQACQMVGVDLSQLRELQGKAMALRAEIQPRTETDGVLILSVTPPQDLAAQPGEPQRLAYRYNEGLMSISAAPAQGAVMNMNARFTIAGDRLRFQGDWSLVDNSRNRNVKALGGTWSGGKAAQ